MMSKMDEIFRRIMNDRDIFWIKKEIFKKEDWAILKDNINNLDEFEKIIDEKKKSLIEEKNRLSNENKKKEIDECVNICNKLKEAIVKTPNIINQMLDILQSFGIVRCNLPDNMDDYGKVIERYSLATVEQYFLDKTGRESNSHRKKALKKVFEYVKELYNANISPLEISYFVRKLESLVKFWEV